MIKKNKTIEMAFVIANHSIVLIMMVILSAVMLLHPAESFEIRESDYETHVKNSNGQTYIAHVIEQSDLVVKFKCTCAPWNKCDLKYMIKLSK